MENILKEIQKFKEKEDKQKSIRKTTTPNDILIHNDYAEVVLRNNKQQIVGLTKIDLNDINSIKKYKWCLHPTGYAETRTNKKTIKMHMLILNQKKGQVGHHINRDKLDNTRKNLKAKDRQDHTLYLHRKEQKTIIIDLRNK